MYKNLREDYYEENILKFYGEDGVISLFNTLSFFFDEEFYYQCYFKKIFLYIVDILKNNNYTFNNNDENIPIKFNKIKLDEEEKFDIKQKVNFIHMLQVFSKKINYIKDIIIFFLIKFIIMLF